MNLNQSEIKEEKELLEKVIEFNLLLGSSHICFREIFDKVELEPIDKDVPEAHRDDSLTEEQLLQLAEKAEILDAKIKELEDKIEVVSSKIREIKEQLPDESKNDEDTWPDELKVLVNDWKALHREWEKAKGRRWRIQAAIDSKGKQSIQLFGLFSPQEKKVKLFLKNIEKHAKKYGTDKSVCTIKTFIHEMFHAWNYFSSGCKERTVREIDEPMAEFGTLLFLQEITKLDPIFEPIFDYAKINVHNKQDNIGKLTAYGFGYYLFSLINSKEQNTVQKLLEAYSRKAGSIIAFPKLIHQIKDLLYPYYPREKESGVYKLFWRVIFNKTITGQVWSKSGKTNIVTDNDILLFDDNVDDITPIEYEGSGDQLIKIENNGVFMIYYCHRHRSWHPLFDEIFEEIAEIKYREKNVIFVRPQNDKKAYLITHFDIRRIIEIRNHSNMTSNSGNLLQSRCLSADDFMVYNGTNTDMGDNCLFAKSNQSYYYVFPIVRNKVRIAETDFDNVQKFPQIFGFKSDGVDYVCIVRKEKAVIYTPLGSQIGGPFDLFTDWTSKYPVVMLEEKYNYFSFKKNDVYFETWFDDCGLAEELEGEWLFKVVENGEYKILDENGNNVSENHDILLQWIDESSKDRG